MEKFIDQLVQLMTDFPPELAVVLIASLPLIELRGSLPVAISIYDMGLTEALIWSIIGNALPILPLLLLFQPVSKWMSRRFGWYRRLYHWLHDRTLKKSKNIEKYGPLGLILFVAVPIPTTGAWTGCIAATLFGIPVWKSFTYILLGIIIAGVAVGLFSDQFLRFG